MKSLARVCLCTCFAATCFAQSREPLCPKHIEEPSYPPVARAAHLMGKIALSVTITADGTVSDAQATNVEGPLRLLARSAIENIRRWTFSKPPSAPYKETITYDYEFDESLPAAGGEKNFPVVTRVTFDLPDRVTILTNLSTIETMTSKTP